MPTADSHIFNVSSVVAISGAQADTQATAPTANQESNDINVLLSGASVTAQPGDFTFKKWAPGHYVKTQGNQSKPDQDAYVATVIGEINNFVGDIPEIGGALVQLSWANLNPTGTTYDYTDLDLIIAAIDAISGDKKLLLEITWKSFSSGSNDVVMPSDLEDDWTYTVLPNGSAGNGAAMWEPTVYNRYKLMLADLAANYDSNATLQVVTTTESAPSLQGTSPLGYTAVRLRDAFNAISDQFAESFRFTTAAINLNSLNSQLVNMMEHAYELGVGIHNPDVADANAETLFVGDNLGGANPETAVRDYRGTIYKGNVASSPALGGKDDVGPPSNIIDLIQVIGTTHMAWITSRASPNSWDDIKDAIQANPDLATACPSQYPGCAI